MSEFHMLIGLPASGKSTFAKAAKQAGFLIFSSDEFRELHPSADNPTVFHSLQRGIRQSLDAGRDCLLDATNLTRKGRKETIQYVRSSTDKIVGHLFVVPIDVCIQRNIERENKHGVTDGVIWRMAKSFQTPWYGEGFDEIVLHKDEKISGGEQEILGYTREMLNNLPQDNPHHTLTVGKHEEKAEDYIDREYICTENYPFEKYAARYHDDGKFFTKTFADSRGNATDIAHFYKHENIGAYLFLVRSLYTDTIEYELTDWGKLFISCLIAYHMRPSVWKESAKALAKDREVLGKEMMDSLERLHAADMQAK